MAELNEEQQATINQAREQALATALEAFNQLDVNGDGKVDRNEVAQLANAQVIEGANEDLKAQKIDEFFKSFDENGDGFIQREEWLNFFGKLFDSVIDKGLAGQ